MDKCQYKYATMSILDIDAISAEVALEACLEVLGRSEDTQAALKPAQLAYSCSKQSLL